MCGYGYQAARKLIKTNKIEKMHSNEIMCCYAININSFVCVKYQFQYAS